MIFRVNARLIECAERLADTEIFCDLFLFDIKSSDLPAEPFAKP